MENLDPSSSMFILVAAVAGIVLLFIFLYFVPVNLWITAQFSNVKVGIGELIGMRIRKVPPSIIVNSLITATKAGVELTTNDLETHYMAGGNIPNVIRALISADKANINLTFKQATAIDLAGRDVFEAVQISVNPKVINTPNVAAVAADGIQLIAKARVTVRANIAQLVGGAGEETILARVGEGIVTSIGSAATHKSVLENPDKISKLVLQRGLDAGTAFEILSIDIADIDVGTNIGAKLQIDQASADLKVAEARAEERRAMAVALEQEMKARNVEMRAKVIEAEAEIPKAIAEAFRTGKLGVMDYYRMENIQSDTSMRESIANSDESKDSSKGKNEKK
ncbi:flotillin-like protein FloA [Algoriphagus persicinus]|uniref:flotillin-like protein FloA n=1 Tax=Algoriphagus persicinus TaxID=3108754 RepID=UPI002B3AA07C|nr:MULTISPECIES: flotillin-like protein FloA [unclassified Algoriphagus]MEB2782205.1 flotillin-like protein FloA [Algoriphagus sp. C2-6-M1]MEB2784773.1 flotillin-like protein FloA [Algoriphagus sp. E1-3-M2]